MNFTVATMAKSLAAYLSPVFPGVSFYEDPNQQGTHIPCMFLQQRYSYLESQLGGRWLRRIGLDLVYLEDYNLPNLQSLYQTAAEKLDTALETFEYNDGESNGKVLIRTYDRQWNIEPDELHYKFEIKELVTPPKEKEVKMQDIEDLKERVV